MEKELFEIEFNKLKEQYNFWWDYDCDYEAIANINISQPKENGEFLFKLTNWRNDLDGAIEVMKNELNYFKSINKL